MVEADRQGDVVIIRLVGSFDDAVLLSEALGRFVTGQDRNVVMDLRRCRRLLSPALRVLVRLKRDLRPRDGDLNLLWVRPRDGFLPPDGPGIFDVYETESEAVAAFTART
jgi:anti-anti-sigma regulatory factor